MTLKNRPYCVVAAAFWFALAGLGIHVTDDRVIVRSWLRSRVLPRMDVAGAHAVAYDGALTPGTSTFLVMPQLLLRAGDPIDVPAVIGLRRTGRIQRLTQRLTEAVAWTP